MRAYLTLAQSSKAEQRALRRYIKRWLGRAVRLLGPSFALRELDLQTKQHGDLLTRSDELRARFFASPKSFPYYSSARLNLAFCKIIEHLIHFAGRARRC